MPRNRKWSLPLRYSNGNITRISHFSQECYMYVHFIFLQLITSNITRTAQTKKLIVECILLDYELYSEESIASIFMVNDFYRIQLLTWRWRRYFVSKHRKSSTRVYVTIQNTIDIFFTTVGTSNIRPKT